jgi:D-sedoheptulose 7-phosphate isomerase
VLGHGSYPGVHREIPLKINNYNEMKKYIENLMERYPVLVPVEQNLHEAAECLVKCYESGGKLLVCGNGGSCADADHIVGELMKGFCKKRPVSENLSKKLIELGGERGDYLSQNLQMGLPAISLATHSALITAVTNDTDGTLIFAQQVMGYGNPGDVLLAISTSGNSKNVIDAILVAKAKGLKTIGMTGESGGKMKLLCDILINVPSGSTPYVQELHLPVYHMLCLVLEDHFFKS